MVLKTTFNLARQVQTFAKPFTHGYAQSFVAASQSSLSQNNSIGLWGNNVTGRLGKTQTHHNSTFPAFANKHGQHGGNADSGLAAYYEAWQKKKLEGKGSEWQQFQFAKRIEWEPLSAAETPNKTKDSVAVEDVEQVSGVAPKREGLDRSYSTSAVDDFKKAVGDEQAVADALAKVDEAIVKEAAKAKEEAEKQDLQAKDAKQDVVQEQAQSSVEEPDSLSSAVPSVESPATAPLTDITAATSLSDSELFQERLHELARTRRYAEIPAVFESMLVAGIKPSSSTYNALLQAAATLTRPDAKVVPKVLDVYTDMLNRRVDPDESTYSILMEVLSRRALDVVASKRVLEEKRARYGGLEEPGKFLFRSNEAEFDALKEDQALDVAVSMFNAYNALESKRPLAEKTFRMIITACAEQRRMGDMVRIYGLMESQKVTPRAEMFCNMIQAFGASGDLRSAVECYDEYKALAIANNDGQIQLNRKDNDVYAALIKAYVVCDRQDGGQRFLERVEVTKFDTESTSVLNDTVGLRAFVPAWLDMGKFKEAFAYINENLSAPARNIGLSALSIRAADRDQVELATRAFDSLDQDFDISAPAMAMCAMHIRTGNLEAAVPFWNLVEAAPAKISFIEPTVMHTIALIGSGNIEQGIHQARQMFSRIREQLAVSNQSRKATVERIDEAIELIGRDLQTRAVPFSVQANMQLMWAMVENGGLVTRVANQLLANLGPEEIVSLHGEDVLLVLQVQAHMMLSLSALDIAGSARFSHLLDIVCSRAMPCDQRTVELVEKVLSKLERPDLTHRWHAHRFMLSGHMYSTAQYYAPPPPAPAFDDTYDPYVGTTDNKGSVAITDLLEKTHGRPAAHLNEALVKFKNMRRSGRHPRFFTYAKLITAASKENRLNLAEDILSLAKQDVPYLPQYRIVKYGWVTILDAMVAAYLTAGDRAMAAQYHQDLLDMGAAPSANTFGLYITTLKESTKTFDEATEAVKIFLRAKAEGVEPSSFLYNALIGKLGKARRIDDCLFYFSEMRNLGIRPTSVTYGTIVNALCRVSDEKFAEELFEEMESMPNYRPRPAPYHSMMQFFLSTKRDRSKVLSYYERMRSKHIQPTTHTYKLLIDTYATLDPVDMPAAEAVLDQIHAAGGIPEAVHYAALIHAKGCVVHDMAGAREMFDRVMAERSVRAQPCLYQALFEAMVANHDIAGTEEVLSHMASRGVEMTPYIANSLIHGWAWAKNIEKAKAIYDSVAPEKREPSTYEAMTRAFMIVDDRDQAMSVVNEGLSRGYPSAVANKMVELVGASQTS